MHQAFLHAPITVPPKRRKHILSDFLSFITTISEKVITAEKFFIKIQQEIVHEIQIACYNPEA